MSTLAPHIVNGLALGLLFALIALGFMLVVGLMESDAFRFQDAREAVE